MLVLCVVMLRVFSPFVQIVDRQRMNMGLVPVMVVDEDRLWSEGTHQKHEYDEERRTPPPKERDTLKR